MNEPQLNLEELRGTIREVLAAEATPQHMHKLFDTGETRDRSFEKVMANLGWPVIGIAEAQGGLGLGLAGLAVLYEELGRVPVALPVLPTQLVAAALQQRRSANPDPVLDAIARGEISAAWVEPPAALASDTGRLEGEARHILGLGDADVLLVSIDEERAAIVKADAAGVEIQRRQAVDFTRSLGDVRFTGVDVSPFPVAAAPLRRHAWLGIASDCIGGAESILERTVEYMKVRVQFDQPIGAFQALKHRAANLQLTLEQARGVVAEAMTEGEGTAALGLAALAKATAADAYAAIAADAVQLHGGIGYTWEHDCHIFLKRAQLNRHVFGSSETLLETAAQALVECA